MGAEVVLFNPREGLPEGSRFDVVVGGVGMIMGCLKRLGCQMVGTDCYPDSLQPFLGRKTWSSTIGEVLDGQSSWPIFVKPKQAKLFAGRVVTSASDLVAHVRCGGDTEILCSSPVTFVSEWRCFVLRGQILDVRHYCGDWRCQVNSGVIEQSVTRFQDAPAGYAIDFGLTDKGETILVEVNDGYALGTYGLEYHAYAHLLAARWFELVGLPDPYDYGPLPSPLI